MGLFNWIFGQFIDVIAWTDSSQDTMVYRFNRQGHEIKYGAKLTVRESQMAVFVNEGVIADILAPGIYELETKNIPILTSLKHWDHGFNSPFKAEVYFISTKRFIDLKWGTKNPIMVRDPEFAMVRLRAFGTYEIRINDPKLFLQEIVGTDGHFTTDEIESQLTNLIVSKFTTVMGKDQTPVLDLAASYEKFGSYITEHIAPSFKEYGLSLTKMLVENISLPEEVEKAIDTRASRELTGNLDAHLKYQGGQALGNGAGAINDMVGIVMGQQMAQAMDKQIATPPAIPTEKAHYHIAVDGVSKGPYSFKKIQEKIEKGKLVRDTLLWKEGMESWERADKVLQSSFATIPPPLP